MDGREIGKDSLQDGKEERAVCAQQIGSLQKSLICIKESQYSTPLLVVLFSCALKISSILIVMCSCALYWPLTRGVPAAILIWQINMIN